MAERTNGTVTATFLKVLTTGSFVKLRVEVKTEFRVFPIIKEEKLVSPFSVDEGGCVVGGVLSVVGGVVGGVVVGGVSGGVLGGVVGGVSIGGVTGGITLGGTGHQPPTG